MKKSYLLIGGILIINLFVFGAYYLTTNKTKPLIPVTVSQIETPKSQVSPTPFEFQEMTIPYLRARSFQSSLGEKRQVSQNPYYTSYLTSYDSEGFKVNAQLTVPKGQQPSGGWPAVVFVHGYIPPQNYQTLVNYASFVDYLAKEELVIFKIDLRGHGNSEGEPGGGYFSADYVIDTLNARAALQTSDEVNPNLIGLWGHSMAGNVAARALAAQPQIPAVVIWAGAVYTYSDFTQYGIDDNSYQPPQADSPSRKKRNELIAKYGQFDPNSTFWKQVPMTNYLDGIKGAIGLHHARNDNVVKIDYSRNLNQLLDQNGTIVHELHEYPSGGHNFTGASFTEAMQKTTTFYKQYLK